MLIKTKNNKSLILKKLQAEHLDQLHDYLQGLSDETKKRFGPHPFDKTSVAAFYNTSGLHWGYIAVDPNSDQICGYAIIKLGYLEHDLPRLKSYGILPGQATDGTFAPSIADAWQSCGLGKALLQFIIADLRQHTPINRIILWGGVQADNDKAVNFYKNNGFITVGSFVYNGNNLDMIRELYPANRATTS